MLTYSMSEPIHTTFLEEWVLKAGDAELRQLCDLGQVLLYQLIYDRLKGVRNLGRPGMAR